MEEDSPLVHVVVTSDKPRAAQAESVRSWTFTVVSPGLLACPYWIMISPMPTPSLEPTGID